MVTRQRIESVDILRGLTIAAMILVNTPGSWSQVYAPLLHSNWYGLSPTDLIFPFFLFIVGISIFFSYKNKPNNKGTYVKIIVRSLKLIGLGLFLNLFLPYFPFINDFEILRLPGILQRIGIVFLISSILYLNCNWKILLGLGISILIGYWLLLGFTSFPNGTLPTFNRASNNWAMYIDLQIIGSNHMWKPDFDPEGLFSTLPAIVSCLSGILIGKVLSNHFKNNVIKLFIISALLLIIGYLFNIWFPISKNIWSSSFVIVTSGWATLILAVIYYITDVRKIKFGAVFKYMGMNAITVYFISMFITKTFYLTKIGSGRDIHSYLYETLFTHEFLSDKLSSLLYALVVVAFYSILSYALFKKKIFIKV
jgi:predicted acyltransferase